MPEKVERHIQAFNQYVDAELVITNGTIVDKLGNPLDNAFCPNVKAVTSANVKKKVGQCLKKIRPPALEKNQAIWPKNA